MLPLSNFVKSNGTIHPVEREMNFMEDILI